MKHKKIIIFSILIVIVIAATTIVAMRLIKKETLTTTPNTAQTDTSGSLDGQSKKGDDAFKSALTAYNSGNAEEAKKQLDVALAYYQAAGDEQGIANVNAQYPLLKAIPPKPPRSSASSGK